MQKILTESYIEATQFLLMTLDLQNYMKEQLISINFNLKKGKVLNILVISRLIQH